MNGEMWLNNNAQDLEAKLSSPPFSIDIWPVADTPSKDCVRSIQCLCLPAMVPTANGQYIVPKDNVHRYVSLELDVTRLNSIHRHLWLAGLPRGARPLHKQLLLGRQVVVTEQADLHLVWLKSRIFIKPLPRFLLNSEHWLRYMCRDQALAKSARGFLLSYAWLICHQSDVKIAHQLGLLPAEIHWEQWTSFVEDLLQHLDLQSPDTINERYRFGELRLTRLNWIYPCSTNNFKFRNFQRGYFQGPEWYSQFLSDNFGWLVAVFVYVSIVLSAMQVGLGTRKLADDKRFQHVSYGFSVFAIAMPAIVVAVMFITTAVVVSYNVRATRRYNRKVGNHPGPFIGPLKARP